MKWKRRKINKKYRINNYNKFKEIKYFRKELSNNKKPNIENYIKSKK